MSYDVFIKFEGGSDVRGESADSTHPDEIEVLSYSWGVNQASSMSAAGGLGASRVSVMDFTLTKRLDRASPALLLACCSATRFRSVVVSLCRAGADRTTFAQFKFEDVLISSVQTSGGPGGGDNYPMETVSLTFAKFTVGYRAQTAQGGFDRPMFAGWDLLGNKSSGSPLPMK
jgi:type VI secretion system secreted protein Hcp